MSVIKIPLLATLSDRANAIVVKEVRQAVKSKVMIVTFMLILLVSIVIAVGFTASRSTSGPYDQSHGSDMVATLSVIELFFGCVLVSFTALRGMMSELQEKTHEMVAITGIRPISIVWGKLVSVFVQLLVYFSGIAPFIAFAYLLGGVSIVEAVLPTVFSFFLSLLFGILAINQAASIRREQARPMISALFLILSLVLFGFLASGMVEMIEARWMGVEFSISFALVYLVSFTMLFATCVTRFMPETSNRSGPVRVAAFGAILLTCGVCASGRWWMNPTAYSWASYILNIILLMMAGISMAVASVGKPGLTLRMRKSLPRRKPLAFLVSPFLSGPGFGWIFSMLLIVIVEGSAALSWNSAPRSLYQPNPTHLAVIPLYFIIYYGLGSLVLNSIKALTNLSGLKAAINYFAPILFFLLVLFLHEIVSGGNLNKRDPVYYLQPFGWTDGLWGSSSTNLAEVALVVIIGTAGTVLLLRLAVATLDFKALRVALAENEKDRLAAESAPDV